MEKLRLIVAALGVAAALAGCVFSQNEYIENADFSLALPAFDKAAKPLALGVFQNLSGSDTRYLCRRGDGRMARHEYLRWMMSPELLLQRCMYGAFSVDPYGAEDMPRVGCLVYRFEFDEAAAAAKFSAEFFIERAGKRQVIRVDESEPLKGELTGASGAAAMSACVDRGFAKLKGALKK